MVLLPINGFVNLVELKTSAKFTMKLTLIFNRGLRRISWKSQINQINKNPKKFKDKNKYIKIILNSCVSDDKILVNIKVN